MVGDEVEDADNIRSAIAGAGRALGYVCAPALFQHIIERCVDEPCDVASYKKNGDMLYRALTDIGYTCIKPEGAFYLWVKSLEADAQAFSKQALNHELLIVPSDSFGTKGWVRLGYCVSEDTIVQSIPAFKALFAQYQ